MGAVEEWTFPAAGSATTATGSAMAAAVKVKIEAVGWEFERALARWCPPKKEAAVKAADEPSSPTAEKRAGGTDPKKKKVSSTKLSEMELEGDHYEMLGLEDKEHEATDDDIAKAYKKRCLETHPDKTGGDDTLFKKVQTAGDVLMNRVKRKAYDSSLPFDDTIPPAKVDKEDFYEEFGPVFERNAKWYIGGRTKCPKLGDDSTDMETVDAFYSFWLSFKSWRDFSFSAAEHDLEQAEHRDERRWMERENQRAVDKARKQEAARVNMLVERAYKNDPRIKRRDQQREAEKVAIREAKRKEEEDRKRREVEEAERKKREEEEEKVRRKERMAEGKRLRQGIRKVIRPFDGAEEDGDIAMADADWLMTKISNEEMTALLESIEGREKAEVAKLVYAAVEQTEEKLQQDRKGRPIGERAAELKKKKAQELQKEKEKAAEENAPWADEDLIELQKACVKFPAGTMNRWERLSEYMLGKKTPQQCLKQVKILEKEYRLPQQSSSLKAASNKADIPKAEKRDNLAEDKSNPRQFKAAEAKEAEKPEAAPADEVWSVSEQKALETALRDLKAYKEKDKWEKISAAVGSKTKKQCVARYKFLCAAVKK